MKRGLFVEAAELDAMRHQCLIVWNQIGHDLLGAAEACGVEPKNADLVDGLIDCTYASFTDDQRTLLLKPAVRRRLERSLQLW